MIVLGIETSTARSSVAALVDGVVVTDEHHEDARGHGAFLGPAVRRCLDAVGGAAAVDLVAVGTGPGLYTGLRVGMATAAAFASARAAPIIGIGGLDVLARTAQVEPACVVVTTLDARRGQVFWAVHEPDQERSDALRCVDGPRVGAREQLDDAVAELAARAADGKVLVVGEVGGDSVLRPEAGVLAQLAAERLGAIGPRRAAAECVPERLEAVYLRDADVRIGWDERGGARGGVSS
jgi:tRNA threonylcarbamoyl adenosine modification protein YeaZ